MIRTDNIDAIRIASAAFALCLCSAAGVLPDWVFGVAAVGAGVVLCAWAAWARPVQLPAAWAAALVLLAQFFRPVLVLFVAVLGFEEVAASLIDEVVPSGAGIPVRRLQYPHSRIKAVAFTLFRPPRFFSC